LQTLLNTNAYTNVRSLNYADIVRAITNSESHDAETVLDHNALALGSKPEKKSLVVVIREGVVQRSTVNDKYKSPRSITIVVSDNITNSHA
jgi:hypothetical protein